MLMCQIKFLVIFKFFKTILPDKHVIIMIIVVYLNLINSINWFFIINKLLGIDF